MNRPLFSDVTVNGETILTSAIAAEAQNHAAPNGKPGLAWRAAARALVIRALLLQEAARRGLTPDPAEVGPGKFETDDEALMRAVIEAEVVPAAPTEDELRETWRMNPERFCSPPLWEASHILIAADPDNDAEALKKAEGLADQAGRPGAQFARLAAENSACESRQNGGALGQLGPGDTVPEFEAALKRLEEGEVTADPVRTRFGFHIIRMDAVAPGRPLPFEAVRAQLAEAFEKAAWIREAHAFTDRLVAQANVTGIDLEAV
ncbi:peptidylprolyl isomerase [uncultured Aliiroseovarius sp.]|uniref:peptidylprolyl isomerase n=1 Tax=uncultured Aliiroseovarius sp. TaxID=1658783 RepID=UPI00259821B3|nr:peptidylprolyl isomerase [uncultured Aliiroseovarius sp.]